MQLDRVCYLKENGMIILETEMRETTVILYKWYITMLTKLIQPGIYLKSSPLEAATLPLDQKITQHRYFL